MTRTEYSDNLGCLPDIIKDHFNLTFLKIQSWVSPGRAEFIENIFQAKHQNRAIISYEIYPFINPLRGRRFYSHSNNPEALLIAKILDELGYKVDYVMYNAQINLKKRHYDLAFGLDPMFGKIKQLCKPKTSIYYATGSYYKSRKQAENSRLKELLRRKSSENLREDSFLLCGDYSENSIDSSEHIICIGDEFTRLTHPISLRPNIHLVPISTYNFFPWPELKQLKNISLGRRHFLTFTSSIFILKGLDILLEVFKSNPHLHLYVAGNIDSDPAFKKLYNNELFNTVNIHLVGWVNVHTHAFRRLAMQCDFVILPSASEGVNGAIPNCMNAGLIPIITKEVSVTIKNAGILLPNAEMRTIAQTINRAAKLPTKRVTAMADQAYLTSRANYSLASFEGSFRQALLNILGTDKE